MWSDLCHLLGLEVYAELNEQERSQRLNEIQPLLREAMAKCRYDTIYKQLDELGIAFGPVSTLEEVLQDEQVVARRLAVKIDGPNGVQTFVRQPLMIDGQMGEITRQAPRLGQHNEELLGVLAASPKPVPQSA